MALTEQERQEINDLARQFEAATGTQAVAAIVGKADDYPDVPWKAFALGAAMAAMAVVADEFIRQDWQHPHPAAGRGGDTGGGGAMLRGGHDDTRVRAAVSQPRAGARRGTAARSRYLFATGNVRHRRAGRHPGFGRALRTAHCDPAGQRHCAPRLATRTGRIIAVVGPHLAAERPVEAFRAGFAALAELLKQKGINPARHGNELADDAVVEGGT